MAAMKHGKKRDRRPGPASAPLGGDRRDRGLREALAREYGVEKTPGSFHEKFQKTLRELPEEMPVRRRPVLLVLRGAAAAMAVLMVTFVSLLGLNTTYPQLTEALPGLGQVFQAMNSGRLGGRGRTPAVPESTPTPQPKKEFQPVTVEASGWGIEDLRVDSAWCDGRSLCLELSLGLSKELQGYGDWGPQDQEAGQEPLVLRAGTIVGYWGDEGEERSVGEDYSIELSAGGQSYVGIGEFSDFTVSGEDPARARGLGRVEMDEDMRQAVSGAEELDVALLLPSLSIVQYEEPVETLEPGFGVKFAVPVDTSEDRRFTQQTTDNGATLLEVDYAPSQVEIEMDLPFIGYYGDMLVYPDREAQTPNEYANDYSPLGVYPVLEGLGDQDKGFTLDRAEALEDTDPGSDTRNRMRFVFRPEGGGTRAQAAPLRLTVYEAPGGDQLSYGRVVTELAIDLNTGRVTPGENYLAEGREKVDTARDYRYPRGIGCFTNGFLCRWVSFGEGEASRINLLTPYPGELRTLLFNGWSEEGELVQSVPISVDLEQSEQGSGGESWQCVQTLLELPGSGEQYLLLQIDIWEPRNMTDEDWDGEPVPPIARLELVDGNTGETLIDDLSAAYESALREIWGAPAEAPVTEAGEEDEAAGAAIW